MIGSESVEEEEECDWKEILRLPQLAPTPPGPTDICGVAMAGPDGHWKHTGWHRVNPKLSRIGSRTNPTPCVLSFQIDMSCRLIC